MSSYLYKTVLTKLPPYLNEIILPLQMSHQYTDYFQALCCTTTLFQNSFLPFTITQCNKLDFDKNISSHAMFFCLLSFIRPLENDTYGIYYLFGVSY